MPMTSWLKKTSSAVLFLGLLSGGNAERVCAQESVPTLQVETRLVLLDTTVLDATGNQVAGLTRDDFELLIDGKERNIVSFDHVQALVPSAAIQNPHAVLDVRHAEEFGSSPLTMIVLDEVNTHFQDSAFAVRSLERALQNQPATLPQATEIFVLKDTGIQLLQGFTRDRNLLLQSLSKVQVQNAWHLEESHSVGEGVADRLAVSLSSLEEIAHSVRSIASHKTMLWLGAGFPSVDPTTLTPSVQRMLDKDLKHVTNSLLEARISLDAIDPASTAAGLTEITDAAQFAFLEAAGDSSSTLADPFDKSLDFDLLAPVSGGRVLRGRNDVDRLIGQAVRAGGSYYSIGFKPDSDAEAQAKFHSIEVRCRKKGLIVLGRQGYYSASTPFSEDTRDRIQEDMNDAVVSAVPMTDIKILVQWKNQGQAKIVVNSDSLHWEKDAQGAFKANVQILAASLDKHHAVVAHHMLAETAHVVESGKPEMSSYPVSFMIDVPASAKASTIRFVVRDAVTGHMGSLDLPLQQ